MSIVWLTGYSGSGKSTIAKAVVELGPAWVVLDGDVTRNGLRADLGGRHDFGARAESLRFIPHLAKLIHDLGHPVIVDYINPWEKYRDYARGVVGDENFFLVHVATSLEVCRQRDAKGLYAQGAKNLPGVDCSYDPPTRPNLFVLPDCTPMAAARLIVQETNNEHIS